MVISGIELPKSFGILVRGQGGGGSDSRFSLLSRNVQAGFREVESLKIPETRIEPTYFLITRCIGADDVGEGKGLVLRPSDLCGLFRRKDTSAHAA